MKLVSVLCFLSILSTLASLAKCPSNNEQPSGTASDPFLLLNPCMPSRHHGTLAKLKKLYRLPNKHAKGTSLLYISILLVTLSNDVQIQPGPRMPKYPCGSCPQ